MVINKNELYKEIQLFTGFICWFTVWNRMFNSWENFFKDLTKGSPDCIVELGVLLAD